MVVSSGLIGVVALLGMRVEDAGGGRARLSFTPGRHHANPFPVVHGGLHTALVDVAMPGITGIELATIARRSWPALPILLMTGYADTELLRKCADHELLHKPFKAAELQDKVRQAMSRPPVLNQG